MRVQFVAQPYEDASNLRQFLDDVCGDPQYSELHCVVAWAKRSGLRVVADGLRAYRGRDGVSTLLVGISQGGESRQGLELADELFDRVFAVHDEGVTFHPKVYLAEGPTMARLLVGSSNLTAGGIQANYEASLEVELDLGQQQDVALRDSIRAYVDRLIADVEVTKPLDPDLLAELSRNRRYRVQDEDEITVQPEPDEAIGSDTGTADEPSLFGRSSQRKRGYPPASRLGARGTRRPSRTGEPAGPALFEPATREDVSAAERRWFKPLPPGDAQHPTRPDTHPTFALRLTQAHHPIDQTTYFRHLFFGSLPWRPDERPRRTGGEVTDVEFRITLPGRPPQTATLLVAHDPKRVAGQGNFATSIHWGVLTDALRAVDYTGQIVTLERFSDGTFGLTIGPTATGDFLP
jgi:hypothetical protein